MVTIQRLNFVPAFVFLECYEGKDTVFIHSVQRPVAIVKAANYMFCYSRIECQLLNEIIIRWGVKAPMLRLKIGGCGPPVRADKVQQKRKGAHGHKKMVDDWIFWVQVLIISDVAINFFFHIIQLKKYCCQQDALRDLSNRFGRVESSLNCVDMQTRWINDALSEREEREETERSIANAAGEAEETD